MPYANPDDRRRWLQKRNAERYWARREAAIAQLGGRCVECGTEKNLEFDHRDPATKEGWLHQLFSGGSQEALARELGKCQLLCMKHHIEKGRYDRSRRLGFARRRRKS